MKRKKKIHIGQIVLNIFFVIICIGYVYPLLLLVSISLEGESTKYFSIIPKSFSLNAYYLIFKNPMRIVNAYKVTIFYSVVGVLCSLFVMVMFSYALSRSYFKYRKILSFFVFFTTLFSGGLVPSFVINSRYLHLDNTILIYILPGLVNAWNIIVIRTYFQGLPKELFESAKVDGAKEFTLCFKVAIPLSTPVLASVGFLRFIGAWNDWSTSQIYIRNTKLYSLQYLLKIIIDSVDAMQQMLLEGKTSNEFVVQLENIESMRFAMALVAAGPMIIIFPFFQKYFSKGLTLGSVKG